MTTANRILIIDDEPFLRSTLGAILHRVGYHILEAASAQEGLALIKKRPCDLIFLDLQMPDKDGLQLLPDIQRLLPDVPVLILTANGSLEKVIQALRMGVCDYLLKPVDPGQIITRVDDLLKEKHSQVDQPEEVNEIGEPVILGPEGIETVHPSHLSQDDSDEISHSARYLCLGPFALDLRTHHFTLNGNPVTLPACAFDYLAVLIRHSPQVVSYQNLVYESQGYCLSQTEARDLARWRIHRLRKVFRANQLEGEYIISVPGSGYKLMISPEEEEI